MISRRGSASMNAASMNVEAARPLNESFISCVSSAGSARSICTSRNRSSRRRIANGCNFPGTRMVIPALSEGIGRFLFRACGRRSRFHETGCEEYSAVSGLTNGTARAVMSICFDLRNKYPGCLRAAAVWEETMYLGLDLGTSGVKALLIDEAQRIIASATGALEVSRRHAGWSEQDPAQWIAAAEEAI